VFGNYLFFDKLDVLGGYLRSQDDWKDAPDGAATNFIANGYRGELDYYVRQGFAFMGRYDRLSRTIATGPVAHTEAWALGGEKALTDLGNVVIRATYSQGRDTDPVSGSVTTDKLFKLDLRLMW
jgi:predicted porin